MINVESAGEIAETFTFFVSVHLGVSFREITLKF